MVETIRASSVQTLVVSVESPQRWNGNPDHYQIMANTSDGISSTQQCDAATASGAKTKKTDCTLINLLDYAVYDISVRACRKKEESIDDLAPLCSKWILKGAPRTWPNSKCNQQQNTFEP